MRFQIEITKGRISGDKKKIKLEPVCVWQILEHIAIYTHHQQTSNILTKNEIRMVRTDVASGTESLPKFTVKRELIYLYLMMRKAKVHTSILISKLMFQSLRLHLGI